MEADMRHGKDTGGAGPRNDQSHGGDRVSWRPLLLLSLAQFMVILDATIVNVALPSIGRDLGFAGGDLQWVVSAYVLMTGGLLLLGGRLSDLLGRRRVFMTGLLIFTAASLASGLAPSAGALIASRAAQGLGAAMLSPSALAIITATYSGAQRTTALSTWGALGGAGAAAGMLFGGMLTSWLSWEWVFFVNVPTGIAVALLGPRLIARGRAAGGGLGELDLPGAVSLVSGLGLLVYALQGTGAHGWGSARTLGLLALSLAILGVFAAIERRARRPLLPAATWRIPALAPSAGLMLGATSILVGISFLNTLLLQSVLGASPLETGFAFLPGVLAIGLVAHLGPRLLVRFGSRAMLAAGFAVIAGAELLLRGASSDASYVTELLPGLLVLGVGIGVTFVSVSVTAMSSVSDASAGVASGLMTTAHELGAAFGVAIFSSIAIGAGTAGAAGFIGGYHDAMTAGAIIAAGLAVASAATIPALRPSSAAGVALH